MARALGIPDGHIPADLATFRSYMDEMNHSLAPSDQMLEEVA